MAERKLFAGPRVRRFRKGLGLTQAQMAADLGVSASYLNLIERDQRPLSARVLLKLAETFDLDLRAFAADADQDIVADLDEVAADPVLEGFAFDPGEWRELAERQPRIAEAFVRVHGAYREAVSDVSALTDRLTDTGAGGAASSELPVEEVRDAFQALDNHIPALEAAAEDFVSRTDLEDGAIFSALSRRLRVEHAVATRILPYDVMGGALRRYDRHARRLLLSEMLEPAARVFQTAHQLGLFEISDTLDALVADAPLSSPEARRLYRIGLANYFAGAVMMPYDRFAQAAIDLRHDLDVLGRRFSASFEQVAHRLTTLRRPGGRGVPFFLIRVDQAGNVSKRFGGRVFHFARAGGACPRWNLYDAFRTPGRVLAQAVEMPDGGRFISVARTVRRPVAAPGAPAQLLAVALGCEVEHARSVVYADGLDVTGRDAATMIGVNCRLCERTACSQRAHPPLRRTLYIDENHRGLSPFAFRSE